MRHTAKVTAAVVMAVVALFAAPAHPQANATLRIATTPIDLGAQALYANDLGFFKRAGLDVDLSVLTSGSVVASAVAGGSIDIGQANIVALAAAHASGLPFAIVAPAGYYTSKAPTTELVVAPPLAAGSSASLAAVPGRTLEIPRVVATRRVELFEAVNTGTLVVNEMPVKAAPRRLSN